VLRARYLPPIPCHRRTGGGPLLPPGNRPITLLAARGGAIGSEELAQALQDTGSLGRCLWLRLDAADRDPSAFAHAIAHAAEWAFPGTGDLLASELTRSPDGSVAPDELARAIASVLPGDAVVVLEDGCGVANTRPFVLFGKAWSTLAATRAPVVVVAHGRPGRRLRAVASLAPTARSREVGARGLPAAREGESALPPHLIDRLVRVAAGRSALVNDVVDAASAERGDLVAEVVATARAPRDLLAGLSARLLAEAGPDELDVLHAVSRLSYWHPDLGSSADTAWLRPWLLPLQHEWHWLRPFWAGSLAGGLRRVRRGPSRQCHFEPGVTSRTVVDDSGRSRAGRSRAGGRSTVMVRLLGSFELAVDGRPVTTWRGHLGPSILKYLLAQPKRACPRDVLLDVFWPSVMPELARNRLQVALCGVRRALEAVTDARLIEFRDGAYVVGQSINVELDIDAFERLVESGRHDELNGHTELSVDRYTEAVTVYRGDFLADTPYEEWTTLTRETLRIKYLDLLDRLARLLLEQDRDGECIDVAERILHQDTCREDAHRLLMRCYARQGRTHQALRQFDLCCRSLREAMGVSPSQATLDVYQSLRGVARMDAVDGALEGTH
jgi:DNA-binding SARP family transcriptional activator